MAGPEDDADGAEIDKEQEDGIEEFDPGKEDVIDTDDGGAIVTMDDGEADAEDNRAFYENIIDIFDNTLLESMATDLLDKIELDKKSREKRIEQYTDALKRTGLGDDAPGGAQFQGASKVIHPILIEGVIDYSSRAVAELMPPDGPVKMYIPGEVTKERAKKAERKSKHMNWQFRTQMKEFKTELEQIQTQEALGGVAYLRLVYDTEKKRPVPRFIAVDEVFLPYACSSFYMAERVTWGEVITQLEFERRVKSEIYRNPDGESATINVTSMAPEQSKAAVANDKIEGKDPDPQNTDGQRCVYLSQALVEMTGDKEAPEDRAVPYLISIDSVSRKIVSVVRNWEQEDANFETMFWMIEWPFIPWRGAYPIGLNQVMAGIPAAVTGALRALMDSAHVNNMPSLVKLKGANVVGQTQNVNIGQISEIEGGISGGDIRALMMAIPYNPPSATLYSLMGMLVETGKGVVRTTLDNLAEYNNQMPATTAMALIEQGMKVMSAIHLRQWTAMDNTINVLHRINRLYATDEDIKDDTGTLLAHASDYEGPLDCIPTADPQVFSDAQRFAQIQLIATRSQGNPLYDQRKVEEAILERTRFPNAKDLLVPENKPKYMNAVNENVALTLGRPVAAFPDQDHLAHMQILLDFMLSPIFGQLIIIAPVFLPPALEHLKEHLVYWYVTNAYEVANEAVKQDPDMKDKELSDLIDSKDPEAMQEVDRLMATATMHTTIPHAQTQFKRIPEIVQQVQQLLQSLMPPPITDPAQAAVKTTEMRIQGDMQKTNLIQDRTDQRERMKVDAKTQSDAMKEQGDTQRNTESLASKEQLNKEDNLTALTIAGSEIEAGNKSALETGTGINPNP